MANIGYPLDELGTNPDNKVFERRVLTAKVIDGRCFMIPKVTPFFADGLSITTGTTTLIRDVDYQLILHSPEMVERLDKDVYAGILFHKLTLNQIVDLNYQTPGGDFNLPLGHTAENLARLMRNPIYTTFSQITGTPAGLPTFSHIEDWSAVQDFGDLVNKMNLIYLALLAKGTGGSGGDGSIFLQALQDHINTTGQAHTKEQVGLGNLQNYPVAQYTDFNGPTYPINRYVTPRTVMYAINLFIGDAIDKVKTQISDLEALSQQTQSDWNQLQLEWNDLKTTLNAVSQNYQQMVQQVQGYQQNLVQLNQNYATVIQNQQTWTQKLQEINTTMLEYSQDYVAVIQAKDQLIIEFNALKQAYDSYAQSITNLTNGLSSAVARITGLEKHALYPQTKVITQGSYNFKIKAGEKFEITLIGAGGGVGEYITDPPSLSAIMNGEHGGSTSFWCLQSNNGEYTPNNKAIAVAEGGFGGCSSYGNVSGTVSSWGIGGRGGAFEVQQSLIEPIELSNGEGGLKGYGDFNATISTQNQGYEYFGTKWGKGALTNNAVGQGGEGAIASFRYENKTQKELDFQVVVGVRGRSYNPSKNNATGGLAIIKKITT